MIPRAPRSPLFPYTTLFRSLQRLGLLETRGEPRGDEDQIAGVLHRESGVLGREQDRKSTRLNSSHTVISYAVFCLKKKIEGKESAIVSVTTNGAVTNAPDAT